jgi:hypothetical protein
MTSLAFHEEKCLQVLAAKDDIAAAAPLAIYHCLLPLLRRAGATDVSATCGRLKSENVFAFVIASHY